MSSTRDLELAGHAGSAGIRPAAGPLAGHPARFHLSERAGGILLHPTSLPGPHGCGDLGPPACALVDFLAAAGQRWWQMLPINPPGPGNAPYSACSALAGGPLLVSLDELAAQGLLRQADLRSATGLRSTRVDYPAARSFRTARLRSAFDAFVAGGGLKQRAFISFWAEQAGWLDDYALYAALKTAHGDRPWTRWGWPLRRRRPAALAAARTRLARELDFERFVQFEFERQWSNLRRHASRRGVGLIGDIPIFVAHDSADVWAHPELFQLEADGRAKFVSGTPPDMFSRTGQLWGHPQYRWARHRASGFAWWLGRLRRMFALFDAVRLDHFFGFYRVWSVPGRARTAQHGHWIRTPGRELFQAVQRTLGRLEIFAEDLGVETPGALALRDRFGFPGMRLLQFAFGPGPRQYHAPHNYPRQCVVYPGTHDSDTTVGWFGLLKRAARKSRRAGESSDYERVLRYLGTDGREIHWDLIRLAMLSVANVAIIPAQDLLGLDNEARMNIPATATGNWEWRLRAGAPTAGIARRWRELAVAGDRLRALGNAGQRRRS